GLLELARPTHGSIRGEALGALAAHPGEHPEAVGMLADVLHTGRIDELSSAAQYLAQAGTPEAQKALVDALRGGKWQAAVQAANDLGQAGRAQGHAAPTHAPRTGAPRAHLPHHP